MYWILAVLIGMVTVKYGVAFTVFINNYTKSK